MLSTPFLAENMAVCHDKASWWLFPGCTWVMTELGLAALFVSLLLGPVFWGPPPLGASGLNTMLPPSCPYPQLPVTPSHAHPWVIRWWKSWAKPGSHPGSSRARPENQGFPILPGKLKWRQLILHGQEGDVSKLQTTGTGRSACCFALQQLLENRTVFQTREAEMKYTMRQWSTSISCLIGVILLIINSIWNPFLSLINDNS